MTHITCRLTAKNRDTLGNRVWATFTFSRNISSVSNDAWFVVGRCCTHPDEHISTVVITSSAPAAAAAAAAAISTLAWLSTAIDRDAVTVGSRLLSLAE